MKAWVYRPDQAREAEPCIFLEERPIPHPGPSDVLLRILKVSVCGTDEMLFSGDLKRAQVGIVPGHELCAEITETGPLVTHLQAGEIVAVESHYRQQGSEGEGVIGLWPPTLQDGSPGRMVDGGYAEYAAVPAECVHPLPSNLHNGEFWPSLFEPAGNDFLLAQFVTAETDSKRVGIWGCGPHGLYAQVFLKHFGVEDLTAFEVDDFRREFAGQFGCADRVLSPQDQPLPDPFSVSIDMVGKNGTAFEQCCRQTRPGGTVVLFGLFKKEVEIAGRPANDIIFGRQSITHQVDGKQLTIVGITGREGIWPDLIASVSAHPRLQELLMKPVSVVGPLDLLRDEIQRKRPRVLKRAFLAFE